MSTAPAEPLREAFERAIYQRLKDHPALAGMFLFTDAWLIAQHAADAVLEYANGGASAADGDVNG